MGELTQRENEWLDKATAAAMAAARRVVLGDAAAVPMNTPVGRLSDVEWGWIVAAVIFAWISTRAEQAASEGLKVDDAILAGADNAWNVGAIAAILPQLAGCVAIDWDKPLAAWSRDMMLLFLGTALRLTRHAMAARDNGGGIARKSDVALV